MSILDVAWSHPALRWPYDCPRCEAVQGYLCYNQRGTPLFAPHRSRVKAWRKWRRAGAP